MILILKNTMENQIILIIVKKKERIYVMSVIKKKGIQAIKMIN